MAHPHENCNYKNNYGNEKKNFDSRKLKWMAIIYIHIHYVVYNVTYYLSK